MTIEECKTVEELKEIITNDTIPSFTELGYPNKDFFSRETVSNIIDKAVEIERSRTMGAIDKEISEWTTMAQNLEYIGEPDDIELANEYRENATLISGLKKQIGGSNEKV